jgi:hypothetical protein
MLTKEQRDAIAADHAAGYHLGEIAQRLGVHRNTVARCLRGGEQPAPRRRKVELKADVLAVLATVAVVETCGRCGSPLVYLRTAPNLFWRGLPCGWVCRCVQCREMVTFPLVGLERAHDLAFEEMTRSYRRLREVGS